MQEDVKEFSDYLDILQRRRYAVITVSVILILLSAMVTYLLPATYKSEGLILIEAQEIPVDLVRSTVTGYADQRIAVIQQRVMTTPRVLAIINRYNMYPDLRHKVSNSSLVQRFRDNLTVKMVEADVTDARGNSRKASIAFNVSFLDRSPQLAQRVANELVTEFLNENARTRTDRAGETKAFLQAETDRFQNQLSEIEKEISEYKDMHKDSLPELMPYNLSTIKRLENELISTENQIIVLRDQIVVYSSDKSNIQAFYQDDYRDTVPIENKEVSSLGAAKEKYYQLQAKYSENHPDVVQLKRQIKLLEAGGSEGQGAAEKYKASLATEQENLTHLLQRYSDVHPNVKLAKEKIRRLEQQIKQEKQVQKKSAIKNSETEGKRFNQRNLISVQLTSKIALAEREIERLKARGREIREKIALYEQYIKNTYQVERGFEQLNREHQQTIAKYHELKAKQLEAELAENLETENKGESFTLIEPPQVPSTAEKPNRPKVLFIGIVLSILSGVGFALTAEMLTGGVRGYNDIGRIMGRAPLVVIPIITTRHDLRRESDNRNKALIFGLIILIIMIAFVHFKVIHLETLFVKIVQKISLL